MFSYKLNKQSVIQKSTVKQLGITFVKNKLAQVYEIKFSKNNP